MLGLSSMMAVLALAACVGLAQMLTKTTDDLSVALVETTSEPATEIDPVIAAAENAYAGARELFGGTEFSGEVIARTDDSYAAPLGETKTVWANRSQSLALVIAMEVVSIGVLAFLAGFLISRITKRVISEKE